mmetsp:Transcript_7269/g.20188  ORF Transcript_7269/g.20188 Transcript_7269/m.20188 type:complete len:226 (+) Transcript_7269:154-831(+)
MMKTIQCKKLFGQFLLIDQTFNQKGKVDRDGIRFSRHGRCNGVGNCWPCGHIKANFQVTFFQRTVVRSGKLLCNQGRRRSHHLLYHPRALYHSRYKLQSLVSIFLISYKEPAPESFRRCECLSLRINWPPIRSIRPIMIGKKVPKGQHEVNNKQKRDIEVTCFAHRSQSIQITAFSRGAVPNAPATSITGIVVGHNVNSQNGEHGLGRLNLDRVLQVRSTPNLDG